jgi:transcriptional regulator with XRE-family HTH domain
MKRLKRLRLRRALTIDRLAERSGVDRSTVIRIEQGHTRGSLQTLTELAQALGHPAGRCGELLDELGE